MKITLKAVVDDGATVWQVRNWQNGRYVRKQFQLREDAQEYREQLEKSLTLDAAEEIPLHDRHSVLVAYKRALVGGYTLAQACDLFEHSLLTKVKPLTLEEAVKKFTQEKTLKKLRPRSLDNLKIRTDYLIHKLGPTTKVHDITLSKLTDIMDPEWGDRSIINFRLVASNLFGWAMRNNHCLQNVGAALPKPLGADENTPSILTPKQVREMLAKAREQAPKLVPYIAISCFAGVRNAEFGRLTRENIRSSVIEVPAFKAKTRSRRLVKIQPNLAKWLELGCDLPMKLPRKAWEKIRPTDYKIDAMRRSFVTYHLAMFKSASSTSTESGHSEHVLFKHYRELVSEEQAQEFWNIFP